MIRTLIGMILIPLFFSLLLQAKAFKHSKEQAVSKYAPFVIDGVDINQLTTEELRGFMYVEDEKLSAEIDLWVGKQSLKEVKKYRAKRALPLLAARIAWTAGRALFRSLSRSRPLLSRSRGKLTKQYEKRGNFGSALRDFRSLKPNNIKTFKGPKGLKGVQGTIGRNGKWTVKARSRSSGPDHFPTLEIHRSNPKLRGTLRKLRYRPNQRKLP